MTRSLTKQQPLPTPRKYREPPSLWLFAIAASTGLHSLLLWFVFESRLTLPTEQANNSFTPIEIIELPPSPQTSPDRPKPVTPQPAPQTKFPQTTTPNTDREIALRNNDAIALQQHQQRLEQQRQQQLEQQRQQQLEQQRQQQLEQQRQQQLEQQLAQQRQQQLEQQQRQQQLEQQQRQQEEQERQQQLAQQRQQQLEQQRQQEEQERREREKIGNLPGLEGGSSVDVDKDPIKPIPEKPENNQTKAGFLLVNLSVLDDETQINLNSTPRSGPNNQPGNILKSPPRLQQNSLVNQIPFLDEEDRQKVTQPIKCGILLSIDEKGQIFDPSRNFPGIKVSADSAQYESLCKKYVTEFFKLNQANIEFIPAVATEDVKSPAQLLINLIIQPT